MKPAHIIQYLEDNIEDILTGRAYTITPTTPPEVATRYGETAPMVGVEPVYARGGQAHTLYHWEPANNTSGYHLYTVDATPPLLAAYTHQLLAEHSPVNSQGLDDLRAAHDFLVEDLEDQTIRLLSLLENYMTEWDTETQQNTPHAPKPLAIYSHSDANRVPHQGGMIPSTSLTIHDIPDTILEFFHATRTSLLSGAVFQDDGLAVIIDFAAETLQSKD